METKHADHVAIGCNGTSLRLNWDVNATDPSGR